MNGSAVAGPTGDRALEAERPRVILPEGNRAGGLRFTLLAMLMAAVFFAGVAPTLRWLEFSSGSENLVVGAALEIRRGGPWWIPTLRGKPRTAKPPMPTWIAAGAMKPQTVKNLSNPPMRDQAYRNLAWEVRWPTLLTSCAALVAAAWLGRLLFGDAAGLAALCMMGSSFLFLRLCRSATTDVPIMFWVTAANVFFVAALLRGKRWLGCALGGLAVGLALMSKGPVALAQTIFPLIVLMGWQWWDRRHERKARLGRARLGRARLLPSRISRADEGSAGASPSHLSPATPSPASVSPAVDTSHPFAPEAPRRIGWWPIVIGALLALLVALPWPVSTLWQLSGQLHYWLEEVAAGGQQAYGFDPPWIYLALIPLLLPWTAFFFLGLVLLLREKTDRARLTVLLTIAPIVLMACFAEKHDRYLLPMVAASAIICAVGFLARGVDVEPARRWIAGVTWIALAVIGIGLPIAGAVYCRRLDGPHWWGAGTAIAGALLGAAIVALGWVANPSGRKSMIPTAVVLMIGSQGLFIFGYSSSVRGLSDGRPLADGIARALPADATVWYVDEPERFSRVPVDVLIYLNRIVHPVTQPAELSGMAPGQAVLVHCRGKQTLPPAMRNWKVVATASKNNGTWYACVSPD